MLIHGSGSPLKQRISIFQWPDYIMLYSISRLFISYWTISFLWHVTMETCYRLLEIADLLPLKLLQLTYISYMPIVSQIILYTNHTVLLFMSITLGSDWKVKDEVNESLEEFTCLMYGNTGIKCINKVRTLMLRKMVGDEDKLLGLCPPTTLQGLPLSTHWQGQLPCLSMEEISYSNLRVPTPSGQPWLEQGWRTSWAPVVTWSHPSPFHGGYPWETRWCWWEWWGGWSGWLWGTSRFPWWGWRVKMTDHNDWFSVTSCHFLWLCQ